MLRKLYFFIFTMFAVNSAIALEAAFSHSVYYLPDPIFEGNLNPYLEAHWQVNPKTVHYKTVEGKGIIAKIQTDVIITNDSGNIIKEDHYVYQSTPCANASELSGLTILDQNRYFITSGHLKIQLTLTDINDSSNRFTTSDTFTVPPVTSHAFYGDIEFVDTFYTSGVKTPFRKHGQQFIPLCEGFYDNFKNNLTYYTELYHVEKIIPADFPLYQSVFISKKPNEDPYTKYFRLDTLKEAQSNYYYGSFDISNLPSGNYYLNVSLGTNSHRTLASKCIFFQRLNTKQTKADLAIRKAEIDSTMEHVNFLDLNKTFLVKYTLPQIQAILRMLLPVSDPGSTRAIEGFLKKTDENYMRYFIYNHFKAVDPQDPEKAWKDYSTIVKKVNKQYGTPGRPGYESERGFMYLRYGAPSEIVTRNSESGSLPYELWRYNSLKELSGKNATNAIILFYKNSLSDFDYKVLHTTISDDLHNMAWRSFLYINENSSDHSNSIAEQYIGKN